MTSRLTSSARPVRHLRSLRRPTPSLVLSVSVWVVLVAVSTVIGSVALGWSLPRLVAVQAMLPAVAILGGIAASAAVARRQWMASALGGAVVVSGAALTVPGRVPATLPTWTTDAPTFTVFSSNLRESNETPARALEPALRSDADVVVLNEATARFDEALEASGLLERYPTVIRSDRERGDVLLTRLSASEVEVERHPDLEVPAATVQVGDRAVRVLAVHTQSPRDRNLMPAWKDGFDDLAVSINRHDDVVAVGDFNAAVWNAPLRTFIDFGLVDAHEATGNGWSRSWSFGSGDGGIASVPIMRIDHSLSRGRVAPLVVTDGEIPGSDHRWLLATYAVQQ